MKIGIVCYPSIGGSGVLATELGHELAKAGHQVHFITYEPPFRLRLEEDNLFFHQVEMSQYELIRYPDYALALSVKIAEVAQQYELDILHAHYAVPHAISAYLARQLAGSRKPALITTLHGTDITLVGRDPAYYQIVRFSIEQSDAVTAVSKDLRRKTQDYFQVERPIEVIYNFFTPSKDAKREGVAIRKRLLQKEEALLVHASNFRHVKRVSDVIAIFGEVHKVQPAKLLLVGGGEGVEEARREVYSRGLDDHVIFWGKQTQIDACIAAGDLFLLPSSQESFGLAALEAMAYGVPVIASRVGGIPEVVEDGKTGYLRDCGDVNGMAHAALKLLSNPDQLKTMGNAAQLRVRENFAVGHILPQYLGLYHRAISLRDSPNVDS